MEPKNFSQSIVKAIDFLLSRRTRAGWWQDFDTLAGPSDEWVTGYVSNALAKIEDHRAIQAANRAWKLLSSRRLFSVGWGYNGKVPADADSTVWALHLAAQLEMIHGVKSGHAYRFLSAHQKADGSIATYAEAGPIRLFTKLQKNLSFAGWCQGHPCVTAATACLADFNGRSKCLEYLCSCQHEDGSWRGYWWVDPEYTTSLAVRAFSTSGQAEDRARLNKALSWTIDRLFREIGKTPFTLALCLSILVASGQRADLVPLIERTANHLVEWQLPNGSWTPSAKLRIPPPFITNPDKYSDWVFNARGGGGIQVDQNACFTTATVLSALIDMDHSMNRTANVSTSFA